MKLAARKATLAIAVLGFIFATLAAKKDEPPDLNGTWKLNAQKSKGFPDWRPETTVVVIQGPHQVQFTYFLTPEAAQPFETRSFAMNTREQPYYTAATERAQVSARWHGKELQIRIRHIISNEIADTAWVETDTWALSNDGHELINKSSDGKVFVYEKQKDKVY